MLRGPTGFWLTAKGKGWCSAFKLEARSHKLIDQILEVVGNEADIVKF